MESTQTTASTPSNAPLFHPGRMAITPGAQETLIELMGAAGHIMPLTLIGRHIRGDWAEMDAHDQAANRRALTDGSRVFTLYTVKGTRFWVITDAEDDDGIRFSTTVLLPSEY